MLNEQLWGDLDNTARNMLTIAALIPPPVSLDLWSTASNTTSVEVLRLVDKMREASIMNGYKPKGPGFYYFKDINTVTSLIQLAGYDRIQEIAMGLLPKYESFYPDGPQRWMAFAYIARVSGIQQFDPKILLRAAEYCREKNLADEAAINYEIILEILENDVPVHQKETYIDSVIGLMICRGNQMLLSEQEKLLVKALDYVREIDDPHKLTMLLVLLGKAKLRLGESEQAEQLFDEAWERAQKGDDDSLKKRIALATTENLFFKGQLAEAIARYEEILGNLDELPTDEVSLKACALLGWVYGKCGDTVRGYGLIQSVLEKAKELNLEDLINYTKLMAIFTLHDVNRYGEAEPIFEELLNKPERELSQHILWPLYARKAYLACLETNVKEGAALLDQAFTYAQKWGFRHHRHPVIFDYLSALEDAGSTHPEFNYDIEVNRFIYWPDIYIQGVGFYYRAKRTFKRHGKDEAVLSDIEQSIELFKAAGAKLDQALSQILLGRLFIRQNKPVEASIEIKDAWRVLKYCNEGLFPEDLNQYIGEEAQLSNILDPLVEISSKIGIIRNREELLNQIVSLIMRQTGAERGAFFQQTKTQKMRMIASRNLEPEAIQSQSFDHVTELLLEVTRTGQEVLIPNTTLDSNIPSEKRHVGWRLAFPVFLRDRLLGCFYLERQLSGSEITENTLTIMKLISTQVAIALDNTKAYAKIEKLKNRMEAETLFHRGASIHHGNTTDMIGESKAIKSVITNTMEVARSDASVLIAGETGVGKELVAKAIHRQSSRSNGAFIPISISSLSENLVTSELFGHEKGAFTDAVRDHQGRFELADGGTLFLDEVNSLSLEVQVKLLRVLEEKTFERVGGSKQIRSNFRLIAASNQPLDVLVKKGLFRSDLFYRLNIYPITIPPLRERKEDIPLLVEHFVKMYNKKHKKSFHHTIKHTMRQLKAYDWPGNIRELKHAVERAVLTSKGQKLVFKDFLPTQKTEICDVQTFIPLKEMERNYIIRALEKCGGKVSGSNGAASLLSVNSQTLYSKIRRFGIRKQMVIETGD